MSASMWLAASAVQAEAREMLSIPGGIPPEQHLDTLTSLVERLASVVMDHVEATNTARDQEPAEVAELIEGREYDLMVRVRARVVEVSDGVYVLGLAARDFLQEADRRVVVDRDEVIEAGLVTR